MQENDFDFNSLFPDSMDDPAKKLLICMTAAQAVIRKKLDLVDIPERYDKLNTVYRTLLCLRFKCISNDISNREECLKKLLTSDTFAPKNRNQLMLLITTTFLSLHKIRLSFFEGQKRISCFRFLFFGRRPIQNNRLEHDKHFLFKDCSKDDHTKLQNAIFSSCSQCVIDFHHLSDMEEGMSKKAVSVFKHLSAQSANNKEQSEKLTWDNVYPALLTLHESDIASSLASPDVESKHVEIKRKVKNKCKEGTMYFDVNQEDDEDDFSANLIVRFHLCDSNNFLNRKIFSGIPKNLISLSDSINKNDKANIFLDATRYASYWDDKFQSYLWHLSTKTYTEIPVPRIQHTFNRLVIEGSFANSASIPKFLSQIKSLCQLNTVPFYTRKVLDCCKEDKCLQLHTHHIDDNHKKISLDDVPMVSFSFSSIVSRKYNYIFIFPDV